MSRSGEQTALSLLEEASLRRTKPRLLVLQSLLAASQPVTQEQIAEQLGDKTPNKVTIYRTLEALCEAGLVHKAFLQDRTWHFELAHNCSEHQCHPHFTCTACGQTTCLMDMQVPAVKSSHNGYTIQRQRMQLEGLCPQCGQR
ncbi:MAG: transcriptional repressor [Sedimentisphaerales bacterium]|nr:transcriptional repressor [Sedimentisphaerales bacterium]